VAQGLPGVRPTKPATGRGRGRPRLGEAMSDVVSVFTTVVNMDAISATTSAVLAALSTGQWAAGDGPAQLLRMADAAASRVFQAATSGKAAAAVYCEAAVFAVVEDVMKTSQSNAAGIGIIDERLAALFSAREAASQRVDSLAIGRGVLALFLPSRRACGGLSVEKLRREGSRSPPRAGGGVAQRRAAEGPTGATPPARRNKTRDEREAAMEDEVGGARAAAPTAAPAPRGDGKRRVQAVRRMNM